MSRKPTPYNQILSILHELHKGFPNYNMGRHIATALDGYGDVWGVTDGELLFAFTKYKTQLENDGYFHTPDDLDKIVKDGIDLDNILTEDEYYE